MSWNPDIAVVTPASGRRRSSSGGSGPKKSPRSRSSSAAEEVEVKQIEVEVHQNFGADVRADIDQSEQDYQNKLAATTDESEKEKLVIDHMKGDTDQTLSGPWFVMHTIERGVFNHLPSGKYIIRIVSKGHNGGFDPSEPYHYDVIITTEIGGDPFIWAYNAGAGLPDSPVIHFYPTSAVAIAPKDRRTAILYTTLDPHTFKIHNVEAVKGKKGNYYDATKLKRDQIYEPRIICKATFEHTNGREAKKLSIHDTDTSQV